METIIKVEKNTTGRRFAIGDIHGCIQTFKQLVENQMALTKDDQLFLLGDYIDRGPSSSGVIDYIIELQDQGFEVYALLGNHEDMLFGDAERYNPKVFQRWLRLNGTSDLADETGFAIAPKYLQFLKNLPYCIELDNFYLVHAGFSFNTASIFENTHAMLWTRQMDIDLAKLDGKRIVHGHTPRHIDEIRERVFDRQVEIILDNGCVYKGAQRRHWPDGALGRLIGLNLDTFELFEEDYCG